MMRLEYLPIRGEAKIGVSKEVKEYKEIIDHKNFARFTNKIETIDPFWNRKTFLVVCDGKGNINSQMLDSVTEKIRQNMNTIEELAEARNKGTITREQFEKMRDKLIEKMGLI
jgi:hypothetical protein